MLLRSTLQRLKSALDLLEMRTFMAGQPIRVGQQRLLEWLPRPDQGIGTHSILGW